MMTNLRSMHCDHHISHYTEMAECLRMGQLYIFMRGCIYTRNWRCTVIYCIAFKVKILQQKQTVKSIEMYSFHPSFKQFPLILKKDIYAGPTV